MSLHRKLISELLRNSIYPAQVGGNLIGSIHKSIIRDQEENVDSYKSHRFGKVPLEYRHQNICWIAIVTEGYGEQGVGIELYEDLSKGYKYDEWRENLDAALHFIDEAYGIKESNLMTSDEIRSLGISLFGDL